MVKFQEPEWESEIFENLESESGVKNFEDQESESEPYISDSEALVQIKKKKDEIHFFKLKKISALT